jgi:RHS repeat-associated protein
MLVEEYQYNINGTRTYEMNRLRDISGRSYTYSNEDHLLTAGDVSYQYDQDGFLTRKTNGADITQYDFSARGELLTVTLPDGKYIEYIYDPSGRRIAKKINGTISEKYLWQGMIKLLAVYDGNDNLLMRFEYADVRTPLAMVKAGIKYFLTYDQVGSLKAVADGSGNVLKNIIYDSFGNIISDSDPIFKVPFGFAGGLHDKDTNLIRFGFRDYDPDIGRWTAKDPILFRGGSIDLYGYCLNDPINAVDLIGLEIYGAANAGFAGINYSTSTQNLSRASLTTGSGVIVGGSLSIGYDFGKGIFGHITHDLLGQDSINIGLGKYLGISLAPDFSKVELNFGFGIALPVSYTFPIRNGAWEPIDPIFGDNLYDYFHNIPCK